MMVAVAAMSVVGCSDAWDDHYKNTPESVSQQTLWQAINSREDLKPFAQLLLANGYDKNLDANQRFTVWAPEGDINTTLLTGQQMTDEEVLTQIVENHMARSIWAQASVTEDTVTMLNGKSIALEGTTFNKVPIVEKNIPCSNGILHIISHQVDFNHNLWTYMRQDNDLTDVTNYLYSFNRSVFSPELSTEGGVVNGEKYYTDSVFVTTNDLWSSIGYLNNESQSYDMLMPTNAAWEAKVAEFASYYKYKNIDEVENSEKYAKRNLVNYLVYNNSSKEERPAYMDQNIVATIPCSNGKMLKTDDLAIEPLETFVEPLIVEAESSANILEVNSAASSRVNVNVANTGLSNSSYMVLTHTSSIKKPSVVVALPNVLSCKYDIGVVMVPVNMTKYGYSSSVDQKKMRLNFELRDANSGTTEKFSKLEYEGTKVDTVWVKKGHEFPYCDYYPSKEVKNAAVTLTITSDAGSRDTQYSRDLYIDCVVLKPTK